MKSGNDFIFLTSLSNWPSLFWLWIIRTLGEPVAFPVICVVNKLTHSPTLIRVNESQKHTAMQKKQIA